MKTVLVLLSCCITLFASVPYLLAVMRGEDKPRMASWALWTVLSGIGSAAAFETHQIPAAVFALAVSLESAAVVALGYRKGNWAFARLDAAGFLGAALGVVALVILRAPAVATGLVIGVELVATMPTFMHAWRQPYDESASPYGLFMVSELIILAMSDYSTFTGYAFPVFYLVQDGFLAGIILFGPHRHEGVDPYAPVPVVVKPKAGELNHREGPVAAQQVAPVMVAAAPEATTLARVLEAEAKASLKPAEASKPEIKASLSHKPNRAGWHKAPVKVSFTARDDRVGIVSCSPPVEIRTDGPGQEVTGSAVNFAGTSVGVTVKLNIDQTPPILGEPAWSANPVERGDKVTLTVPAIDHTSGVLRGEYIMNNADTGPGKGMPMEVVDGRLMVELDTDLPERPYMIRVRAVDVAGNWSPLMPVTLNIVSKE